MKRATPIQLNEDERRYLEVYETAASGSATDALSPGALVCWVALSRV